jgi:hypothetical protein
LVGVGSPAVKSAALSPVSVNAASREADAVLEGPVTGDPAWTTALP